MSEFTDFFDDLLHDRLNDVKISTIGRIETFDKEKMRADVTPLLKKKDGDQEIEYAMLKQLPVTFILAGDFYIRPEYKTGDLVQIAFSTNDIAEALKDTNSIESKKIFTLENAFVTGGIAKTNWTHPSEFSEPGLLIGHKDGNAFTKYCNDNIIFKLGGVDMILTTEGIEMAGNTLKMTNDGININNNALIIKP